MARRQVTTSLQCSRCKVRRREQAMHRVIFLVCFFLLLNQLPIAAQSSTLPGQQEKIDPADDLYCDVGDWTTTSGEEFHSEINPFRCSVPQRIAVKEASLTRIGDGGSGTDKAIQ